MRMLAQPAAGVQHSLTNSASRLVESSEITFNLNLSAKSDTGAQIYADTGNTGNRPGAGHGIGKAG
jgi:hypothetical protein